MGTYRQYCPISRASEILAERWNPLIVRNLMFGADTFSKLARGVPAMSRSMLIKRLQELERDGIIEREPKPDGHGHLYRLTDAGEDLGDVIDSLGVWGERWVEVTTEHADPGFALWAWCQVQMNTAALPRDRTVVAFEFPQEPPGSRYYWLLVESGDAELCYSDPGDEPDLYVTAESLAFVDWHRGRLDWPDALRSGRINVMGNRNMARGLPSWNTHEPLVREETSSA
ncbi:MAG TPA: helix-turn-helix domain-containing protein [Acidimicrobiia bacterium]